MIAFTRKIQIACQNIPNSFKKRQTNQSRRNAVAFELIRSVDKSKMQCGRTTNPRSIAHERYTPNLHTEVN